MAAHVTIVEESVVRSYFYCSICDAYFRTGMYAFCHVRTSRHPHRLVSFDTELARERIAEQVRLHSERVRAERMCSCGHDTSAHREVAGFLGRPCVGVFSCHCTAFRSISPHGPSR